MRKVFRHIDKVLLVFGVLGFLGAAAWAALVGFRKLDAIVMQNPALVVEPAPLVSEAVPFPEIARVAWPEPQPQSRGREWLYDVFTPPVIYVNPRTNEFTVTPPVLNEPTVVVEERPFEVDLLRVRQEEYRIQFIGYAGDEGAYIASLELVDSGRIIAARPGQEYGRDQGSFTLKSLEVRREITSTARGTPLTETVGVAVVYDALTGREETITTRERRMLERMQCVLRTRTTPPQDVVLREGMSVTVNNHDYVVVQLSLDPPHAVVSRRAPNSLGAAETKKLTPIMDGAAAENPGAIRSLLSDNSIDLEGRSLFPNMRDGWSVPSDLVSSHP